MGTKTDTEINWNRTESPEIRAHILGQLFYHKGAKNTYSGEKSVSLICGISKNKKANKIKTLQRIDWWLPEKEVVNCTMTRFVAVIT